ncbi:MAG: hypothetical protein FD143_588 [Ignavibacteria bacterium]|nr:MAG: hypothetical protein FD143_588 [Ignavibacteria bacterium]KAF0161659.1 MAG: hypothetical protein FD188_776 [Ignavibacteria bacterium]
MAKKFYLLIILSGILFSIVTAQTNQSIKEGAPKIYIDCGYCDMNYIKEQISIVNYVRDRNDADVHVLSTSQRTGSNGYDYTLYFIGQNEYAGIKDTIKYTTFGTDSEDQSREKLVRALKLGLVKYVYKSKVADQMSISFKMPQAGASSGTEEDPWDFWLFRISTNGNFSGEKSYKSLRINTSISANRTTEDLKLNFSLSNNYNESKFNYDTQNGEETYLDTRRSQSANASLVKAIDGNWSWGIWLGANSSTYNNIDFGASLAPGIEYNFFPYSQSNERQLRVEYKIAGLYHSYVEETFYFKKKENLLEHSLGITFSLIRPWGSVSVGTETKNFLDDFVNISYGVFASTNLRLFKGFSLNLFADYSRIGKQITLPFVGATREEVLLRRKQLETSYNYWAYVGVSYSFGSIFNNAVNPRFGTSGGGTTITFSN